MKKLALLLAFGLLAACGGSGGETSSASAPVGESTFTVKIKEPSKKELFLPYSVEITNADKIRRRVVITNPSLDKPTQVFKKYYDYPTVGQDATVIAAGLTFTLPYTSGYTIEFLEYSAQVGGFVKYDNLAGAAPTPADPLVPFGAFISVDTATPAVMVAPATTNIIKYDKQTFDLNTSTGVTLTANSAPVPTLDFPVQPSTPYSYGGLTGIPAKSVSPYFEVKANFPTLSMYNSSNWDLLTRKRETSTPANVETDFSSKVASSTASIASPISWSNNEYEIRGFAIFYLNDSILLPGENYTKFNMTTATPTFVPVVVDTRDPAILNP